MARIPLLDTIALGICALVCASGATAQVASRNLDLTSHRDDYHTVNPAFFNAYSACWSYIHGDGREYAVIGTVTGTAIYDVTDPSSPGPPVFIAGPESGHREMKSYRNWIYVVTEGGGGAGQPLPGVQIIRMTQPETPVLAATYAVNFNRSHTVSVDTTRALLYCNGTRNAAGQATGLRILSLANPESPVEVGWWPGGAVPVPDSSYVHDSEPVGDSLYASTIAVPWRERIIDVANPAAPTQVASWLTGGMAVHNASLDRSRKYLYVTHERIGQPMRAFELADVSASPTPAAIAEYTPNPQGVVHNVHVRGDELYVAGYTEGTRVLDISDPAHPAEFAWSDTYPGVPPQWFFGVWEVCPFFPSGTVISSDMQTGLYVYRPVRDYGTVRVETEVQDQLGEWSAEGGVEVHVVTQGDSATTPKDGVVRFAPSPGLHTIVARKFGWKDASAQVLVTAGSSQTIVLRLGARRHSTFKGRVTDSATQEPLGEAEIDLAYSPLHEHTDSSGTYVFDDVPENHYRVEVRRPGSLPLVQEFEIGPGHTEQDFALVSANRWDPLTTGLGWVVGAPGDSAVRGVWTRVEPLGTSVGPSEPDVAHTGAAPRVWDALSSSPNDRGVHHGGLEGEGTMPGQVQPEHDRSPDPDSMCFVTGQGTIPNNVTEADVDGTFFPAGWYHGAQTTLTTPTLDLSGMNNPTLGYWQWFFSEFGALEDWLAVSISNDDGVTWVPVDTTRGRHNHWEERAVIVSDYLPPTSQVRLRFVAADYGIYSVVEAAIDDLSIYEGNITVGVGPAGARRPLEFRAPRPNPSTESTRIDLDVRAPQETVVEILDLAGRRVRTLYRGMRPVGRLSLSWNGRSEAGSLMAPGLYFARARSARGHVEARIVRVR